MSNGIDRDRYSLTDLHKRLQVVEVIVFISLALNVVQGYYTIHHQKEIKSIEQQTGARP